MRHVLVYSTGVLPKSETFVADQARSLSRWQPILVGRDWRDDGLAIDDLLAPEMHAPTAAHPSAFNLALRRVTRRVPVLETVAQRTRPDLIHAHFLTGGYDVVASLRPLPCPLVVTAHGFDATVYSSPSKTARPTLWFHGLLRRRLVRRPIEFLAVSSFIRDQLIAFGASPDRVVVHHIGVDTDRFVPSTGRRRSGILFVGRLVEKKGVLDLLHAVARLRARGTVVPVTVIGDGPQRAAAERLITRERLDVSFMGSQPREEVLAAMQRAAVQCNPSRTARSGDREGFGMVLAEAQATGLPVVATRCGGMVDAVDDGRTGLLVPEGDVEALALALERCLTDGPLWSHMSAAARPWVLEHFDLTRQTSRLEDLYDDWAMAGS